MLRAAFQGGAHPLPALLSGSLHLLVHLGLEALGLGRPDLELHELQARVAHLHVLFGELEEALDLRNHFRPQDAEAVLEDVLYSQEDRKRRPDPDGLVVALGLEPVATFEAVLSEAVELFFGLLVVGGDELGEVLVEGLFAFDLHQLPAADVIARAACFLPDPPIAPELLLLAARQQPLQLVSEHVVVGLVPLGEAVLEETVGFGLAYSGNE